MSEMFDRLRMAVFEEIARQVGAEVDGKQAIVKHGGSIGVAAEPVVRAMLNVLREPTEAMSMACDNPQKAEYYWAMMIDEALR